MGKEFLSVRGGRAVGVDKEHGSKAVTTWRLWLQCLCLVKEPMLLGSSVMSSVVKYYL